MRETAGDSPNLKSALAHAWVHDTRDHIAFPTRGYQLRMFQVRSHF